MLGYLNGLRALLASWVFLGHLSAVCGTKIPVLNSNGPAVDGFMIISGFLMVFTTRQTLMAKATLDGAIQFYLVRFFRLAPLYFLMVGLVWALGPGWEDLFADWQAAISGDSPGFSWHDAIYNGLQKEHGVLLHLTFMHGLFPSQATSTPLSDWSLSLEMQFYLLFPLICAAGILSVVKAPWMAALCVLLALVTPMYLGAYRMPGLWAHFTQPSVLLYKLNVFLCGMLLVKWFDARQGGHRHTYLWLGLSMVCILPARPSVWVVYAALIFMMMRPESGLARFMSSKVLATLGDWSYAVYLIHIFTMVPILWKLDQWIGMGRWPAETRFFVGCLVCIPLIFMVAALLYRFVERPGIVLGRKIVQGLKNG
jgi:peptidoglycan/LPS O-acetylase OafA/YrhL